MTLKAIELFAGVGDQRQALKNANIGHEIVAISEIDNYAILAYGKLYVQTLNLGDIKNIQEMPQVDMLEDNVDNKYFLSEKLITCFTSMKNINGLVRGVRFRPKYITDDYAWTIITEPGSRVTDNYIIIPQATKDGYALTEVGDGVYTNRCESKRGVV